MLKKKKVVVLGATGSIGKNTALELETYSDRFEVSGLAARNSIGVYKIKK